MSWPSPQLGQVWYERTKWGWIRWKIARIMLGKVKLRSDEICETKTVKISNLYRKYRLEASNV